MKSARQRRTSTAPLPAVAIQREIYRRMSPTRKWRQAMALYETARKLKAAGVRLLHPDWSDARVEAEVKRIFLHAVN